MEHRNHIQQANHNFDFHEVINKSHPDHYFDWKITCLFYVALHYMKAHIKNKNVDPGESHDEIAKLINPTNPDSKLKVSKTCWYNYRNLYQYSRTARYEGFMNKDLFNEDKRNDYSNCMKCLLDIKKYVKDGGVKVD